MTVRTASAAQSTATAPILRVGLLAVTSIYSMGAGESVSAGDIIQMIRVPANAKPIWLGLTSNYVQASLTVGDGLDDNRYIAIGSSSAAFATSTHNPSQAAVYSPYTYSVEDTIDIYISLVSVSSIAGAFNLTAILQFDGPSS